MTIKFVIAIIINQKIIKKLDKTSKLTNRTPSAAIKAAILFEESSLLLEEFCLFMNKNQLQFNFNDYYEG